MEGLIGCSKESKLSKEEKEYYGDMEGKYRAESDMHSLLNAAQIRKDKKRHEAAKYCMRKKQKELNAAIKEGE